jgi:uncharacterized protein YhdP
LKVSPQSLQFDLHPGARNQELNPTLDCFTNEIFKADGRFYLAGNLQGRGKVQDLLKTSSGRLDLKVSDGHIYRDIIVLNVVKFLNVNQVLTGSVTAKQMEETGFGFRFFRNETRLKDGRLRYEKIILNGDEMTITGTGEIDLLHEHIDFTLLVAPQKTLDSILGRIPLIGAIFHTIDTIPLSLKGTFEDIHVYPLAPSAIGYELKEVMKDTIGIPIKLTHIDGLRRSKGSGEQ